MPPDKKQMSIWDHLDELRMALIRSAVALGVGTLAGFWLVKPIFRLLMIPQEHLGVNVRLVFSAPMDGFMAHFKLALLSGCAMASPFILFFLAQFVAPALHESERRIARIAVVAGAGCFLVGLAFGYGILFIMLPALMYFNLDGVENLWSLRTYLDFCFRMMLGGGVIFEMPVVLMVLARIGLVKAEWLSRVRPYAIIAIFIVAAIVTPSPDALSQVLVAVPMWGLYEVSIFLVRGQQAKRQQHLADSAGA